MLWPRSTDVVVKSGVAIAADFGARLGINSAPDAVILKTACVVWKITSKPIASLKRLSNLDNLLSSQHGSASTIQYMVRVIRSLHRKQNSELYDDARVQITCDSLRGILDAVTQVRAEAPPRDYTGHYATGFNLIQLSLTAQLPEYRHCPFPRSPSNGE
eukprot:4495433-Pleurochrysis_carterae.AAC.3